FRLLGPIILAAAAVTLGNASNTTTPTLTLPIAIPHNQYFVASSLISAVEYLHRAFPDHPAVYTQEGHFVYNYVDPVSGNVTDLVKVGDLYLNAQSLNDVLVGIEDVMCNQLTNPDTDPLPIDAIADLKIATNYITNMASYDYSISDQAYIAKFIRSRKHHNIDPIETPQPHQQYPAPLKYNISIFDDIDGYIVAQLLTSYFNALGIPTTFLNATTNATTTTSSSITPTPASTTVYTTPEPSVTDTNDTGGFRRRRRNGGNLHHLMSRAFSADHIDISVVEGFGSTSAGSGSGSSGRAPTTFTEALSNVRINNEAIGVDRGLVLHPQLSVRSVAGGVQLYALENARIPVTNGLSGVGAYAAIRESNLRASTSANVGASDRNFQVIVKIWLRNLPSLRFTVFLKRTQETLFPPVNKIQVIKLLQALAKFVNVSVMLQQTMPPIKFIRTYTTTLPKNKIPVAAKRISYPDKEFDSLMAVLEGQDDNVAPDVEFDEAGFLAGLAPPGQDHPAEETFKAAQYRGRHEPKQLKLWRKAAGWDFSNFPSGWAVPPTNPEWTKFYLAGKNIPNVPVNSQPNPSPSYAGVKTQCISDSYWAQTIDDGPSQYTPQLLATLRANGQKTTFFNLGTNVRQNACILEHERQEGHVNCLHSWSHTAMTSQTNDEIVAEVLWTAAIMQRVLGVAPTCFRPPYGSIDERVVAVLNAMGLTVIWINHDSADWSYQQDESSVGPAVDNISKWLNGATPGGILSLEHDLYQYEVEIGQKVSDLIKQSNRKPVTIETCLGMSGLSQGFRFPTTFTIPAASGSC
ncbi:chitin deacetylase, partial [Blyttiomyces sp. JEL0837]